MMLMNGDDCHANNKSFDIDFNGNQLQQSNNFTRGISLILTDPTGFALDTKLESPTPTNQLTNLDQNNSEKTYEDLSNLLLQQPIKQQLPASTTLAQLEPVRANTPPHNHQEGTMILSLNECSIDSHDSSSTYSPMKRRLESESTTEIVKSKRGRKPTSLADSSVSSPAPTRRNKFTKQEIYENNTKKTLVFFGNKKVEKDTVEYKDRRERNNDAVKKCREKAEKEQSKREEHMKALDEENKKLLEKVNSMAKEMDVLKGIIISMRPENKLPENILTLLNEVDAM